jgi:hypothetical protein
VLCVARVRRCACSDVCAVHSGCGCAGRRTVVRGLCVCMLCVSVRCAVRGLLACAVLGDTSHDTDVVLWWVGLVASCVSVRAWLCGAMVSGSAALVGMCARCALGLWECEESWLRHRRDAECACWACIAGAVSSAVSRVLYRSVVFADVCRRVCVAAPRLAVAGV